MTRTLEPHAWLRQWVANTAGCPEAMFDDGTALFADRLLDSTDFVELILAIEEATGRAIDVAQLNPDAFRNIDAILRHFFVEQDDAA